MTQRKKEGGGQVIKWAVSTFKLQLRNFPPLSLPPLFLVLSFLSFPLFLFNYLYFFSQPNPSAKSVDLNEVVSDFYIPAGCLSADAVALANGPFRQATLCECVE